MPPVAIVLQEIIAQQVIAPLADFAFICFSQQCTVAIIASHKPGNFAVTAVPSAGITLTTALASLVTGKAVSPDYAMTGEVSLRGGILPIGGLPEKLMAAQRAGITKVLIPFDNADDLEDVAAEVKDKLKITPVKKVSDVLKLLLG